jgi:hypothetical protein
MSGAEPGWKLSGGKNMLIEEKIFFKWGQSSILARLYKEIKDLSGGSCPLPIA